jgi:cyclic-di-AMP phosphodiesterase PgpH
VSKRGILGRWFSGLRGDIARRLFALLVLALGTGAFVVEYAGTPIDDLTVGSVADRSVRASASFPFVDWEATLERQRTAEARVQPVFDFDTTLSGRVQTRIADAFDTARHRLVEADANAGDRPPEETDWLVEIRSDFLKILDISLDPETLGRLSSQRWSTDIENLTKKLVNDELGRYIVADRSLLPKKDSTVNVVRILQNSRDEVSLDGFDRVVVPEEVRRSIKMAAFDQAAESMVVDARMAAVAIAQAAVRANFSYNQLITESRRQDAREAVLEVVIQVQRGTTIVREGEVVTQAQFETLHAMTDARGNYGTGGLFFALSFFAGLVFLALYTFSAGFIKKFSTRPRDVEAIAFLALVSIGLGRLILEAAEPLATASGSGMAESSIWYLVPVAGGAMLVRILVNSETALIWTVSTSLMLGVLMEHQIFYTIFFICSGLTAAGGIAHTKERVNVLRAGLLTGLVNAAGALLINLLQVQLGETSTTQPLWDMGFAFLGGNLSAIMVLGMVPMFELFGFITDYKLLELANLNHPLLRQLMLRAPGSYHHSVIVGSLAEAAAESIGCNALMTRVSCYFHDIGKAVKPSYFIENLRDVPNPHDRLAPHQSARIIVNHVLDGAALARQYNLPKPISDAILMHHGTGIIQYFYAKAVEQAGEDMQVDPDDFRYPGQLPDTREAGIIFLADRVEAACRTLKDPTAESIRAMIQKLVNSAVTDGQLEQCPLTISELYTVIDTFTQTLLGIYHHRIEYPGMPVLPPKGDQTGKSSIITLDVAAQSGEQADDSELSLIPTPEA